MHLDVLDRFDPATANGILAAAALASAPDPGVGERPVVLRTSKKRLKQLYKKFGSAWALSMPIRQKVERPCRKCWPTRWPIHLEWR